MADDAAAFCPEKLRENLLRIRPVPKRFLLAFSGGPDSTALLLAIHELRQHLEQDILAIHINHGLQPQADSWAQHCRDFCRSLDIPLQVRNARIDPRTGLGPEAAARQARYEVLAYISRPGDCLLTGQHADDQAETLLLQLLRGSGVEGLAAMHPQRNWHRAGEKRWIARPLLKFRREQLLDYLRSRAEWLDDPSNLDLALRRNFLRHKVLPLLGERWPQARQSLARSATYMFESLQNLQDLVELDRRELQTNEDSLLQRLPLKTFLQLPPRRQRLLLRGLIRKNGWVLPGAERLNSFLRQLAETTTASRCELRWLNHRVAAHAHHIYLDAGSPATRQPGEIDWAEKSDCYGSLRLEGVPELLEGCRIRPRRGGESLRLAGHASSHSLKNIFQKDAVPVWLRDSIPLLWSRQQLLAVGDLWLDREFESRLGETYSRFIWTPSDPRWQAWRDVIISRRQVTKS